MKTNLDLFRRVTPASLGRILISFLSLALHWGISSVYAQDLPYDSGSLGQDGPLRLRTIPSKIDLAPRYMATDEARGQVVLVGREYNANDSMRTFVFDGTNWVRKFPTSSPVPLYNGGMTYDSTRRQLVLCGIPDSGPNQSFKTYTWDGTNWLDKTLGRNPGLRRYFGFAYDPLYRRSILFGGESNGNTPSDAWAWDGTSWTELITFNPPVGQFGGPQSMLYDGASQRILFRGVQPNVGNALFFLNNTNWTWIKDPVQDYNYNTDSTVYDSSRNEVIWVKFGPNSSVLGKTYAWDGTNWNSRPNTVLSGISRAEPVSPQIAYDPQGRSLIVLGAGVDLPQGSHSFGEGVFAQQTRRWNGTNWSFWSGPVIDFDLDRRPSGRWNFSEVIIPPAVELRFTSTNFQTSPLRWLVRSNVVVDGILNLDGAVGGPNTGFASRPRGGPGGGAGGYGGIRFDQSGSFAAGSGEGPGGGLGGPGRDQRGANGSFAKSYGNVYLQPILGGSGGGGQGSTESANGPHGGGGGGGILISASREIIINGLITAQGGDNASGGGIRLVADRVRISSTGNLNAGNDGRVRIEGFFREGVDRSSPAASFGAPIPTQEFDSPGALVIESISGQLTPPNPSGNPLSPDVAFISNGSTTISVRSAGVPDGARVKLRIATSTGVIEKPAVGDVPILIQNNRAIVTVVLPKGPGTVQASASFSPAP